MIDLLCLLLPFALRAVQRPGANWTDDFVAVFAYIVDRILAQTTFRLLVGRGPENGEKTVSDMLENLCKTPSPDQALYVQIALKINRVAGYGHIKAVA